MTSKDVKALISGATFDASKTGIDGLTAEAKSQAYGLGEGRFNVRVLGFKEEDINGQDVEFVYVASENASSGNAFIGRVVAQRWLAETHLAGAGDKGTIEAYMREDKVAARDSKNKVIPGEFEMKTREHYRA